MTGAGQDAMLTCCRCDAALFSQAFRASMRALGSGCRSKRRVLDILLDLSFL
jgi:hypothetical protein